MKLILWINLQQITEYKITIAAFSRRWPLWLGMMTSLRVFLSLVLCNDEYRQSCPSVYTPQLHNMVIIIRYFLNLFHCFLPLSQPSLTKQKGFHCTHEMLQVRLYILVLSLAYSCSMHKIWKLWDLQGKTFSACSILLNWKQAYDRLWKIFKACMFVNRNVCNCT